MTGTRSLFATWLGLLFLLALTAGTSWIPLGWGNLAISLAVAVAKAMLILAIFMKLVRSALLPRLALLCMVLWLGILFGLTMIDYGGR
jgi:cytochrome c oxidase subunit 4